MTFIPGPDTAAPLVAPQRLLELHGAKFGVAAFEVIRALPDRTVFIGLDLDGARRWTIKVGTDAIAGRHAREIAFVGALRSLQAQGQLAGVQVVTDGWQHWGEDGLTYLARPYDPRPELGPERGLNARERRDLAAAIPHLLTVIAAFDEAGPGDAIGTREPIYRAQVTKHIAELEGAGVLCASLADELRALAAALPLQVPVRPVHGDFTPWHVLADVERPSLIDFEFGELEGARFDDLSRLVQKVWTCQRAETIARRLLPMGLARLGVEPGTYWRDAALMALDRTVKGLAESIAWHSDRASARRHAAWNLRRLGEYRVIPNRQALALARHLAHGCDASHGAHGQPAAGGSARRTRIDSRQQSIESTP